ncbi:MAG: 7TM-DISM domain-containing protein [Desulfovibrionaceae bacterium]
MSYSLLPRRALLAALAVMLCCALPALAGTSPLPLTLENGARPADSYMDWMLDPSGSLAVEEVASEVMASRFRPLHMAPFPHEAGTVWLRFTLPARNADAPAPATLLLDMGPDVPGVPSLYAPASVPGSDAPVWRTQQPRQGAVFILPESGTEAQTCYIRLSGVPGFWLSPMLRSPHDAATALERMAHPATLAALAVVMLLCLLRGLGERGQWRIWAALYSGAALAHAWLGAPATPAGHVMLNEAAAVIAPGLALMILPHLGRHFLHTRHISRTLDSQYMLLSLPGAALMLLPLAPDFAWTCRLLPLWPLGTLLLVPTTLGAWLSGLVGARRFLLGCLLPPLGTAIGLALPTTLLPAEILASAPMWGVALGGLIIAGSASVPLPAREEPLPHTDNDACELSLHAGSAREEDIVPLGAPLEGGSVQTHAAPAPAAPRADTLRLYLDSILRQAETLCRAPLATPARHQAEQLVQAVRTLASLTDGKSPASRSPQQETFNLQQLLRGVHERAREAAERKNTALSWYMPPHMGLWYRGDAALIASVLDTLTQSAVQGTTQGAIQISVRRVPESVNPGHLLFTITDTGSGLPLRERPALPFVQAWEMAGAHHGYCSMEYSPRGTSISFSLHLDMTHQQAAAPEEDAVSVLVMDENPSNRQLVSYLLEGLPCRLRESRTPEETAEEQRRMPAALVIVCGRTEGMLDAARGIRRQERAAGASPALLLALTEDDSQWQKLHEAGVTHALARPFTRQALRATVRQLLRPEAPQPVGEKPAVPDLFGADAQAPAASGPAAGQVPDLFSSGTSNGTPDAAPVAPRSTGMPDLRLSPPTPDSRGAMDTSDASLRSSAPLAEAMSVAATPASSPAAGLTMTPAAPAAQAVASSPAEERTHPCAAALPDTGPALPAADAQAAPVQPEEQRTAAPEEKDCAPEDLDLYLDPDALRDPAIRLLKATPEDLHISAHAPQATRMLARKSEPEAAADTAAASDGQEQPVRLSAPVATAAAAQTRDTAALPGTEDPVSAALQRVKALLGARVQRPRPAAEAGGLDINMPAASVRDTETRDARPEASADTATVTESIRQEPAHTAPQAAQESMPDRGEQKPAMAARQDAPRTQEPAEHAGSRYDPFDGLDEPIRQMLLTMDVNIVRARQSFRDGNCKRVRVLASGIALEAEKRGLRVLGRMARCVESAARAEDREALADLLPELENAVERNRIAFTSEN